MEKEIYNFKREWIMINILKISANYFMIIAVVVYLCRL